MALKKDLELHRKWASLMSLLENNMGKRPKDLNNVLFLVGMQELGKGVRDFSKEEKQDLMHIAICKVLSRGGFYVLEGLDEDGWPHWRATSKLPRLGLSEQEQLLKMYTIDYFEEEMNVTL